MKNKKIALWAVIGIVLVLALVFALFVLPKLGSTDGELPQNHEKQIAFTLTVSVEEVGEIFNEQVTAADGTPLIDIMKEYVTENGGVITEESEYGAFVTSICGYEQDYDSELYWSYYVNGEYAMEGASSYCPAEGDVVLFELAAYEG